jgi:hypothetical protein
MAEREFLAFTIREEEVSRDTLKDGHGDHIFEKIIARAEYIYTNQDVLREQSSPCIC